jgi:hypothetical protein
MLKVRASPADELEKLLTAEEYSEQTGE